jgi:hypothetical protein
MLRILLNYKNIAYLFKKIKGFIGFFYEITKFFPSVRK